MTVRKDNEDIERFRSFISKTDVMIEDSFGCLHGDMCISRTPGKEKWVPAFRYAGFLGRTL